MHWETLLWKWHHVLCRRQGYFLDLQYWCEVKGDEKMCNEVTKGSFVCSWKNAAGLRRRIGLLGTWSYRENTTIWTDEQEGVEIKTPLRDENGELALLRMPEIMKVDWEGRKIRIKYSLSHYRSLESMEMVVTAWYLHFGTIMRS